MIIVGPFHLNYSIIFILLIHLFFCFSQGSIWPPMQTCSLILCSVKRLTSLVIISLVRGQNCFFQRLHLGVVPITTVFPESTIRFFFSICTYLAEGGFFFSPMCKYCRSDPHIPLNCAVWGLGMSPNGGWCKCIGTSSLVGFEARPGL